MDAEYEEFCAAHQALMAARGRFQRHVQESDDPNRPDEILLLTTALNSATFRYLKPSTGLLRLTTRIRIEVLPGSRASARALPDASAVPRTVTTLIQLGAD